IHFHFPRWTQIFDHAEWIGILGTIALLLMLRTPQVPVLRPFTHVPPAGRWWEYVVFGLSLAVWIVITVVPMICFVIVLPIVIPFKLLSVYVLGPRATLASALLALPL